MAYTNGFVCTIDIRSQPCKTWFTVYNGEREREKLVEEREEGDESELK